MTPFHASTMTSTLKSAVRMAALAAAMSVGSTAIADDAAPAATETTATVEVPSTPAAPAAPAERRDVVIVRPDMQTFVVGESLGSGVARGMPLPEGKLEKAAYLGVGVSEPQAALTDQLKLPKGVGLVIEFVEKGSPAEKAGIQAHDVFHKLNEQLLINAQQLATLVRTFKPGESVALTVIRKGEPVTLNATLIEREMPELSSTMQTFEFPAMPARALTESPLRFSSELNEENTITITGSGQMTPSVKARVIRVMPGSTSKIIKVDNGLRIELESKDGLKSLLVVNPDGKTLFEGPYNTPEEQEKLPADLREKVKSAEDGIRLKEVPATSPTEPKADADLLQPGLST